jgi:putative tryptophan/tyrosine transport system substrate-binding protein
MRFGRMKRREFITLLGSAALAAPLSALAQEPGRTYRLGILHNQGRQAPQFHHFFDELRRAGFVDNQNLIVDGRGYAVRTEQFAALAAELAKSGLDAIVCGGAVAARSMQEASSTVPILALSDDLVGQGLAQSLARPGANITGISILSTELDSKRQEILMELMPTARRMAALADANTTAPEIMQALQDAARARGVELAVYPIERPERVGPTIDEAKRLGAQALNVLSSPVLNDRRRDIYERTTALRLPTMHQWPENPEEGALIGYGPRLTQLFRQLARQLVKVLRGTKPSDVPVEQPTTVELAINLKTAKALGITFPTALLVRADEVIE